MVCVRLKETEAKEAKVHRKSVKMSPFSGTKASQSQLKGNLN